MNNAQIIVNEMRNSTYSLGDVLKFQLDPSVQFLNTGESYLRFNLVVGEKGQGALINDVATSNYYAPWMLDPQLGAEGLIKSLRISTLGTGRVLEEITDYNVWAKKVKAYEGNQTVENMRQLYYGTDNYDVRQTNLLTERGFDAGNNNTNGVGTQSNNEIEVFLRFSLSGLLGADQVLPVSLMGGGLEVQVQLEDDVQKILMVQGQFNKNGLENATMNAVNRNLIDEVAGYTPESAYGVAVIDNTAAPGQPARSASANITLRSVGGTAGKLDTGVVDSNEKLISTPFYNGQEVIIKTDNGQVVEATIDYITRGGDVLNIIFKNPVDMRDGAFGTVANVKVWVKMRSLNGADYTGALTKSPRLTLSNVEYLCSIYKPSQQEVKRFESAINSPSGYMLDYKTYTNYSNNSSTGSLQVSNLIPCKYSRVYSVFSFWENNSDINVPYKDNLMTPNNEDVKPKRYVYKLNGLLVPNRPVDLDKFQRTREQNGNWNVVALREMKQAFKDCGLPMRDLLRSDVDLVLGRSLTRKPNTYSLRDLQGELRLDVEFDTNNKNLLHHSVVCCVKSVVIKGNDLEVLE